MKLFVESSIAGLPFWDFCCDHGYIGMQALRSEKFSEVHFVDQVPHIMENLESFILRSGRLKPHYRYSFHLADGGELELPVEGNLLIAGVGGFTCKGILKGLTEADFLRAQRLLIAVHSDAEVVLDFIRHQLGKVYFLTEERDYVENDRQRTLYIFDKLRGSVRDELAAK